MNILLATQNTHKIQEIIAILNAIASINIIIPTQSLDIPEGEHSYIDNALIKAKAWSELYPNYYILADDSGIEVEALNNAPGVISAEYAGKNASSQDHINKLLADIGNNPNRKASFICYMLLLSPQQQIFVSRGECHGQIAFIQSENQGFGYDPIFLPIEYNNTKTFSELTEEEKNTISHRYKALIGLKDYIQYLEADNE